MNPTESEWQKSQTLVEAFAHAVTGIWHAFRNERNFLVQVGIYVVAALAGWWLDFSTLELALVALAGGVILALEMVNSAVERLADVVNPQYHADLRLVKDMAAGAVLVASLTAVIVGLLLFIPSLS